MCMWREILSTDYEGKRFVVDGDLIEAFAYEYGRNQKEVADEFHAVTLEQCQKDWLHGWVQHHDTMLGNTAKSLESENAELRKLVADMWPYTCGRHDCQDCEHYELYKGQRFVGECEYHRRMRELGIEAD